MHNTIKTIEILNDLIVINNDRIEGYEKANKEFKERGNTGQARLLFSKFTRASLRYKRELRAKITALTAKMEDNNSFLGKIHLAWIAVKSVFTSRNRKDVLKECTYGEGVMKEAYQHTLNGKSLSADIREVLTIQQGELKEAHDELKKLTDTTD